MDTHCGETHALCSVTERSLSMIHTGTGGSETTSIYTDKCRSTHFTARWTDHFQDVRARQPGPERGCRAPPPEGVYTFLASPVG